MKILFKLARRYPYIFTIMFVCFLLCVTNYTRGTILSGWDTLHPEFNPIVYLKRVFFGVWQDHQGLGALATQSHVAELPRLLIYYPLMLLGQNFVRYAYFFLMIFLGPLGVYYFIQKIIFHDSQEQKTKMAATTASLFYLLNLGILQHFQVPFEMFATHFATLGWIFFFLFSYLETKKINYLILYSATTIFTASISHTPTLWYVYFSAISLVLLSYFLLKRKKEVLKSALLALTITLLLNAFWILPNVYFVLSDGHAVESSKIHTLFSEEAFQQNAAYGKVTDFILLKNFLFNWKIYVGNEQFAPLLRAWEPHLKNPAIIAVGYIFFTFILLGIASLFKQKNKIALSFLPLYILCFFFWMNINPPFGNFFIFLQDKIPFFREIFRFPFTKFSILLIFASTIYFALGISQIFHIVTKLIPKKETLAIFCSCIVLMQIYFMLPAFKGNFINPAMRVQIPSEYFDLFAWFNKQPDGRVATLPIQSFWGWTYYKWGYQGAGFTWFGIKQPILEREFDRWNPLNEQYYREMSQAIYTKDYTLFSHVLEKYNIAYILLDKNVTSPGSDKKTLFYPEIEQMLQGRTDIGNPIHFGKNILVYPTKHSTSSIQQIENPITVNPFLNVGYEDAAFTRYGQYVNDLSKTSDEKNTVVYPFRNIIDNQNRINKDTAFLTQEGVSFLANQAITHEEKNRYITYEQEIPAQIILTREGKNISVSLYPYIVKYSSFSTTPLLIDTQIPEQKAFKQITLSINNVYAITIDDLAENTPLLLGTVMLHTKKDNTIGIYTNNDEAPMIPKFSSQSIESSACDQYNINNKTFGFTIDKNKDGFTVLGKKTAVCLILPLVGAIPELKTDTIAKASYENTSDAPASLCIVELKNGICKDQILKNYSSSNNSTTTSWHFPLSAGSESNLGIKIQFDTTENDSSITKSHFSNFSFAVLHPVAEVQLTKTHIQKSLNTLSALPKMKNLLFPYAGNQKLSFDITRMPKTDGRCSDAQFFTYDNKKDILKEKNARYLRYISNDGSLCDHFSYSLLSQANGYIIAINARNVKGLPIRLCIANYNSKRCDLYTTLSKSKTFYTDLFLLPAMDKPKNQNEAQTGYDININNFGIKNQGSINDIESIQIIPIPYNWLTQFQLNEPISRVRKTAINFSSITHPHQGLYLINNGESLKKTDVITIDTAYHPGWRAYKLTSSNMLFFNVLAETFPFIFGQKIEKHLVVSGWKNGWSLDQKDLTLNKDTHITIIYMPMYLEYLGYFLFAATLSTLLLVLSKQPKH